MSRQIALANINLVPVERWAHTEYSLGYHRDWIRRSTGKDPMSPDAIRDFNALWEMDFNWSTNDGLRGNWPEWGRATDMGHAVYDADGRDKRAVGECPFRELEEVWAFDAVAEYGLPDRAEQVAAYQASIDQARAQYPEQLTTGGYYKTIVSGAIEAFGWDMFLLALSEPDRMERVLDGFFRRTLFHMEAWAATDGFIFEPMTEFAFVAERLWPPAITCRRAFPKNSWSGIAPR